MPNIKIYTDQTVWARHAEDVSALLPSLREMLCRELKVDLHACQIVALPVHGMPHQADINVELYILAAPDRTRDLLISLAEAVRDLLASATMAKIAVRISTLDPQTYIALK